eukprot:2722823-Rhodomonas_salina.1
MRPMRRQVFAKDINAHQALSIDIQQAAGNPNPTVELPNQVHKHIQPNLVCNTAEKLQTPMLQADRRPKPGTGTPKCDKSHIPPLCERARLAHARTHPPPTHNLPLRTPPRPAAPPCSDAHTRVPPARSGVDGPDGVRRKQPGDSDGWVAVQGGVVEARAAVHGARHRGQHCLPPLLPGAPPLLPRPRPLACSLSLSLSRSCCMSFARSLSALSLPSVLSLCAPSCRSSARPSSLSLSLSLSLARSRGLRRPKLTACTRRRARSSGGRTCWLLLTSPSRSPPARSGTLCLLLLLPARGTCRAAFAWANAHVSSVGLTVGLT